MKTFFRPAAALALSLTFVGGAAAERVSSDDNGDSRKLVISQADDAKKIVDAIPPEAAMEKFFATTADGHSIAYAGLTDTDTGGVLFVDGKLLGTLSKQDARAFYSCRGYATAARSHWTDNADAWIASLIAAVTPTANVTLQFSGKSTPQSLKEVSGFGLQQLAFLDLSTNPISLLKKLNSAREKMREQEDYDNALNSLKAIPLGTAEDKLADTQAPEDLLFGESTMVMAYPRFAFEFYLKDGKVAVSQQPSFHRIAQARSALFYAVNTQWKNCRPDAWRNALAKTKAPAEKKEGEAASAATP